MARVSDVIAWMEKIAPASLAEEWDNPGLQVGRPDAEVRHVFLALDPSPETVSAACSAGADMLVTHHPLIFSPLSKIDLREPSGRIVAKAIDAGLTIFSAHTNLDSASGGLNDLLAGMIGMKDLMPLLPVQGDVEFKLVFFVPESHAERVYALLADLPVGKIGNYKGCLFAGPGKGRFIPQKDAHPYTGRVGRHSEVDELRVETRVFQRDLKYVMDEIKKIHPYETVAMDVYPLASRLTPHGIGRVGHLEEPVSLKALALRLKNRLDLKSVRVSGSPDMQVTRVALCTGSGSSLLKSFFADTAQVFVSGDLKYHDAMNALAEGRALIDIGHFASEHIIVAELGKRLAYEARKAGVDMKFTAWEGEKDPFFNL